MARGRVFTRRVWTLRGKRDSRLWIAEVHDAEGRLVWTDNTGYSALGHRVMMREAIRVVQALTVVEQMGNRLAWDWREAVDRAPRL